LIGRRAFSAEIEFRSSTPSKQRVSSLANPARSLAPRQTLCAHFRPKLNSGRAKAIVFETLAKTLVRLPKIQIIKQFQDQRAARLSAALLIILQSAEVRCVRPRLFPARERKPPSRIRGRMRRTTNCGVRNAR
jgi:hypothetical protein